VKSLRHSFGCFVAVIIASAIAACSDTGPESHRGLFVWGPEVEVFIPCGSDEEFWIRTSNRLWDQLSAAHEQGRTRPFEGIYVEVEGFFSGPTNGEDDGAFGTNYDESFTITGVSLLQREPFPNCET
jgi:hypothetical protein